MARSQTVMGGRTSARTEGPPVPVRELHAEISSTQERALELVRQGADAGSRVVARRQLHGHGRLDHRWISPDGGLYVSVVVAAPKRSISLLPIGVGARLSVDLGRAFGVALATKWPNDVLAIGAKGTRPRKLAGVLVDRVPSPRLGWAAIVGVGVNVALDPASLPADLATSVASLSEWCTPAPSLDAVEAVVVDAVVATARALDEPEGAGRVLSLARRSLYGVGRRAIVDGVATGTIAGLGEEGELLVDSGPDRRAVIAGDLRVGEPA